MESKAKEEQHVIAGEDQEHGLPDESLLPPSETDGEHSTHNEKAGNEEAFIDDVTSQGEEAYVAASTEDLHTTQETSHQSKNASGEGDAMKTETTSNNTGEREMTLKEAEADEKLPQRTHHHLRHNLNEDTLKMLKSYLQSDQGEYLDEDAIAVRMLRVDRVTSERIRFDYPYGDSEEDEDDDAALRGAYLAAEDYTLALDFYKKAVADTQTGNPNTALDKRTLNWLRKAMGLHRRNDLWETTPGHLAEQSDESDDEAGSQGPKPRRRTRGMARSTRIRKREQRVTRENMGLDALMLAVTDLEEKFGLFQESTSKKKRMRQKSPRYAGDTSDEENEERHRSKHRSSHMTRKSADEDDDLVRVLIAHLPEPEQEVSKSGRPVRRVNQAERHIKVRVVVGRHNFRDTPKPKSFFFSNKKRKRIGSPSSFEKERHRRRDALRKRRQKAVAAEEGNEELLFGVMDPVDVMKMDATDYVAESNYVSLGLLEWKRRQLWNPASNTTTTSSHETYQKGVSAVPPKLEAFGISVALPPWETVNPIPDMQRQPTTKDPPRRRHSDATYAEWITKMINCLQKSGRSWAFYEFFYSDIDRAWYNVNEFEVEAAKLGVPPNAKLTRKEWSLVRRSIRGRPRRFSKGFIRSEREKLTAYRNYVRQTQASPSKPMKHSYDVPAYIPVGATVTAFHSIFRVVFRGIVLAHDATRNGYLVQFERQELGYQFCVDTEVASHGVPEILVRATDVTLDGTTLGAFSNRHAGPGALSYGTSYGPVHVDQLDPVERDKKAKDALLDIVIAAGSISVGADSLDGTQTVSDIFNSGADLVISSTKKSDSEAALIEKVAERESLVQLIGTIVAALKRKTMLLDAIEKCHKLLETIDLSQTQIFAKFNHVFKDHYSWLQANLRMTNQSLESSLLLLQAMYSGGYSGVRSAEIEKEENRALEKKLIQLCQEDKGHMDLAVPWFAAMAGASSKVGSRAVSTATTFLTASALQNKSTTEADAGKLRAQYLEKRLSAACRLLLNVSYCGALIQSDQREDESDGALALSVGPMKALLQEELKGLVQMPIPLSTGMNVDKLDIADGMRSSAMKDLQEALSCYETELEAMHVAKKIIHRNANM